MGDQEMKAPAIDPLSEQQVIREMAGKWVMISGALRTDKIIISLETSRQVTVSGIKDGKAWEAGGQWKVISNKLVLFVKPAGELPDFIFRIKGRPYIFDPYADTLMSELKREKLPVAPLKASDRELQLQLQSVRPVNGKISKKNILAMLDSMDKGFLNKDAAAIFSNYASNAVLIATVIDGTQTDTITNDTSIHRRDLEIVFKHFDDLFDDYKLQRNDVTVEISPDGRKATSQSTLVETYRSDGKTKSATTKESATFELIDGIIRLTRMDSKETIK